MSGRSEHKPYFIDEHGGIVIDGGHVGCDDVSIKDAVEILNRMSKENHDRFWKLHEERKRLDWWFECNEKERGHVMALVHMKGLSKRDAIDQVMNAKKEVK